MEYLFGSAYQEAVGLMAILALTGIFIGTGPASGSWLHSEGRLRYVMHRSIAALLLNVVLNVTLIPRLGMAGAAWATLLSLMTSYFFFDVVAKSGREMFVVKVRAMNSVCMLEVFLNFLGSNSRLRLSG